MLATGLTPAEARSLGVEGRASLLDDAEGALDAALDRAPAEADVVLLGPRLEDPIGAARRVKMRAPNALVLLLVEPQDAARMEHELLLTPLPGEPARCVPMNALARSAIDSHLTHARLRRRHRETMARVSREASELAPRAAPPRLPHVVERFFDAAPVGILLVEPDGRIVHRNRLARGIAPDARAARTLHDALPGAPPSVVRDLLAPSGEPPRARVRIGNAEGGARTFDATAAPVTLGQDLPLVLVTLDEVTQLVEAQRQLEEARAAAARMDKLVTMGVLVGGLAHEIRTPLTMILNNAMLLEILAKRAQDEEDAREILARLPQHVAEISAGVERVQRLVKDLNRFLRGHAPEHRLVALTPVVDEAVRVFQAAHRGRLLIDARLDARAVVDADAAQIQQVVINLLHNAADASPPGGTVRVETRDVDGAAQLVVADEGPGIPPDVAPRVFEEFFTTKPEGSGLGLSIVRRIVEAHEARITFDTGPEGTTFVVAFPPARDEGSKA